MVVAGLIVVGLAAVKFLPAPVDGGNICYDAGETTLADASILTTLLLDYDVEFLRNEVTMRDLFLPHSLRQSCWQVLRVVST